MYYMYYMLHDNDDDDDNRRSSDCIQGGGHHRISGTQTRGEATYANHNKRERISYIYTYYNEGILSCFK